jgi:hypothetical protein
LAQPSCGSITLAVDGRERRREVNLPLVADPGVSDEDVVLETYEPLPVSGPLPAGVLRSW